MITSIDNNILTRYEESLYKISEKIKNYQKHQGPAPSSEEIASATATLHEYYDYLAQSGVAYGLAAQDVAKNERPFGQFANRYFEHQAQKEGKTAEQLPGIKEQLRILLAHSDASMRSKESFKTEEQYRGIAEYHRNSLKLFDLSPKAWGGTFFEEYMGEGSYMDLGGYDVRVDVKQLQFLKAAATNQKAHGVGFWEYSKTLQEVGFDVPTMTTTASLMRMAISEGPKGTLFVRGTSEEQVAALLRVPVSSVVENAVGGDTINRSPMKIFTVFPDQFASEGSSFSTPPAPRSFSSILEEGFSSQKGRFDVRSGYIDELAESWLLSHPGVRDSGSIMRGLGREADRFLESFSRSKELEWRRSVEVLNKAYKARSSEVNKHCFEMRSAFEDYLNSGGYAKDSPEGERTRLQLVQAKLRKALREEDLSLKDGLHKLRSDHHAQVTAELKQANQQTLDHHNNLMKGVRTPGEKENVQASYNQRIANIDRAHYFSCLCA